MSSSSSTLLSLVLLLASSSAWGMARADGGMLKHIRLYMHETDSGPNATLFATVKPRGGSNPTFGMIGLLDDQLLDGPYPKKSTRLGRFQGLVAFAGLLSPPGMQSVVSFLFNAGKYKGSTLVMVGTVVSFKGAFERAVVGGTGVFRMARGYCVIKAVRNPTPKSTVYEVNLFVKMEGNLLVDTTDADA